MNIFVHITLGTSANVTRGWVSKVECFHFKKMKLKIQTLLIVGVDKTTLTSDLNGLWKHSSSVFNVKLENVFFEDRRYKL